MLCKPAQVVLPAGAAQSAQQESPASMQQPVLVLPALPDTCAEEDTGALQAAQAAPCSAPAMDDTDDHMSDPNGDNDSVVNGFTTADAAAPGPEEPDNPSVSEPLVDSMPAVNYDSVPEIEGRREQPAAAPRVADKPVSDVADTACTAAGVHETREARDGSVADAPIDSEGLGQANQLAEAPANEKAKEGLVDNNNGNASREEAEAGEGVEDRAIEDVDMADEPEEGEDGNPKLDSQPDIMDTQMLMMTQPADTVDVAVRFHGSCIVPCLLSFLFRDLKRAASPNNKLISCTCGCLAP
jgi:hypothetical protein